MIAKCPRSTCIATDIRSDSKLHGTYFRTSDSKWILRWRCISCLRTFSTSTNNPCFGQHKRRVNRPLTLLLCSGVSQRRSALILGIHRKTVARKLKFLAIEARREQAKFLANKLFRKVQFDDLETFEHTKYLPLSISIAVERKTRLILACEVSEMPAKGLLAEKSRRKYGRRKDLRSRGWNKMFSNLKIFTHERAAFESDQNPAYPFFVKKYFPKATHFAVQGARGSLGGQGELKKIKFDPLFSLNHTCAMLRANISRLFRKTWCTTKKSACLEDHLDIYINFHNQVLVQRS